MSGLVFLGLVALTLAILFALRVAGHPLDWDPGPAKGEKPYPWWDRWSKVHLGASAGIAFMAVVLGVPWYYAAGGTLLGAYGWEPIHGYTDRGDLLWDTIGVIVGTQLGVWVR